MGVVIWVQENVSTPPRDTKWDEVKEGEGDV